MCIWILNFTCDSNHCEGALCLFWKNLGTRKLNTTLLRAPANPAWPYLFTHGTRLVVTLETLRDITISVMFGNVITGLVSLTCVKAKQHAEQIQLQFPLEPARAPVLNPRVPSMRDLAQI